MSKTPPTLTQSLELLCSAISTYDSRRQNPIRLIEREFRDALPELAILEIPDPGPTRYALTSAFNAQAPLHRFADLSELTPDILSRCLMQNILLAPDGQRCNFAQQRPVLQALFSSQMLTLQAHLSHVARLNQHTPVALIQDRYADLYRLAVCNYGISHYLEQGTRDNAPVKRKLPALYDSGQTFTELSRDLLSVIRGEAPHRYHTRSLTLDVLQEYLSALHSHALHLAA